MKAEPWFAPGTQEWLEERIEPGWTAFEWGSGGSTLWLAGLVEEITSVEHDEGWWARTANAMPSMVNRHIILVPPEWGEIGPDPSDPDHYRSSCVDDVNFRNYARTIDNDYESFDLVLVDGRARASCVAHAVPRTKRILVLDNALLAATAVHD